MIVEITSVQGRIGRDTIIQLVGTVVGTEREIFIPFDHRMYHHFMEANPDLTFPFRVDFQDDPEEGMTVDVLQGGDQDEEQSDNGSDG